MPQRLSIRAAWIVILLVAAFLRFDDLGERPFHADEATGARILATRLESSLYTFDPHHFHGPLLSLTAQPIANLRNETKWTELSKTTLRLGPAIAGILLVLSPILWIRRLGPLPVLGTAALLATSPILVYYNRMFIHESLLATLAMLVVSAIFSIVKRPTYIQCCLAGIGIALMFTTKETVAISVISWGMAALLCYFMFPKNERTRPTVYLTPLAALCFSTLFLSTLIYTNGFEYPRGISDAFKTYFHYETTEGHEKPWFYYAQLLVWPKHAIGIWWTEGIVFALVVIAGICTPYRKQLSAPFIFVAASTLVHFAIYSIIGYKTPWLMLVPWAHACLLAGFVFHSLGKRSFKYKSWVITLFALGLSYQTYQSIQASGRYANDSRNPYAYVPTTKDVESLEKWLGELASQKSIDSIAVVGNQYWPLPWYLREFETIGYWPEPKADIEEFPVVFAMNDQYEATTNFLSTSHTPLPRSLRANVPITLFLKNEHWEQWIKNPDK